MSDKKRAEAGFLAVIEFQVLADWFELDNRTQRDYAVQIGELLERYTEVDSRWYDADAWTGDFSDFVICEFTNLDAYNELWSEMRRHPFLAHPYARIENVLMGMELEVDGLAKHAGTIRIEEPSLELPPETAKPAKPATVEKPNLPPSTPKPSKPGSDKKKESGETDDLGYVSCHFCGHRLKRTARFCSRCGTKRESHSDGGSQRDPEAIGKNSSS